MSLRWLKPFMPRGLYGRTMLILLLPVITLLIVVSVVFIQRHFDGVTKQMTQNMVREVDLVRETWDPALTRALGIALQNIPEKALPQGDIRRWYDFSGIVVLRELRGNFPDLVRIALPNDDLVQLYFPRETGFVELAFERGRVSARRPHLLFVNLVGAGVLMTLISFLYLRVQLRPITRLAEAAEAFGRGRHIPYRPNGATEVRAAGKAFVEMRERIERQIEQRTLMLSGVSHDLRTPLTRLKLELAMMAPEETRAMLRDVEDMERLLNEFLAFAKGVQLDSPVVQVDPVALVRQIVEDARRTQINVTLRDVRGEGHVGLRADSIRRAIENLINNGVRYGSRTEVSVILTEVQLIIRVEDDGPGIPADQREEATKPFVRLEPARNQNKGTGVGLGLSIVIDVVRAHGGRLELGQSPSLGGLSAVMIIPR